LAPIRLICLDADDTLWEHESYFRLSTQRFVKLLEPFADAAFSQERLIAIERGNLSLYGYGVKGFTLSMLETALEIAGDRLSAATTKAILALGRDLMRHPIHLIDGVAEALGRLAEKGALALISKGDLFDQESKLAASGIGDRFSGVEIVSEKSAETYRRLFARYGVKPDEAVMVGNSLRSDILPALEAGAYAALVPHRLVWAHERAEAPPAQPRFRQLASLAELPGWLDEIAAAARN
jgi:putative hydrolase of the HAD superfamily